MGAVGRTRHKPLLDPGSNPLQPHDSGHGILADLPTLGLQRPMDPGAAVDAAAVGVHRPDLLGQFASPPLAFTDRPATPGVKAAGTHLQNPAHRLDAKGLAMLLNPGELHGCSLAKNAAAFFKISRSIRRRAFSLRKLRSSAASAPSPFGSKPGWEENLPTQPRTLLGSTPKLLAASGIV